MALIEMDFASGNGGSNIKTGSIEVDVSVSKTYTIDTGLGSNLKHFIIWWTNGNSSSQGDGMISYNPVFDANKFTYSYSSGSVRGYAAINTNTSQFGLYISNVSNGVITLQGQDNANTTYCNGTWTWYAE